MLYEKFCTPKELNIITLFSIGTDFSLNDYLISKEVPTSIISLSSVMADQLLDHLGVSKLLSDTPCNRSSFDGTLSGFEIGNYYNMLIFSLFVLSRFPIRFSSTLSSRYTINHVLVGNNHFRLKLLIIGVGL